MTMVGFGIGNILVGKTVDRFGLAIPVGFSGVLMSFGYFLASVSQNIYLLTLIQGIFIGIGASVCFGPFLANISHYFRKFRGVAIGIAASSNYFAGALWPYFIEPFLIQSSWREAYFWIGVICLCLMVPLSWFLREPQKLEIAQSSDLKENQVLTPSGFTPFQIQAMLMLAGVACCVAMSMPQIHLVALCSDLGFGVKVGMEMLSLMLVCGILSRLVFGLLADRIGGVQTLLLSSFLQTISLMLYLAADGLVSLYLISAVFGLSQGGIVPSYTLVIREYLPSKEAGIRIGAVMMATTFGMAFGGWLTGEIFDWTGSYHAALWNGLAWNLLNLMLVGILMIRPILLKLKDNELQPT
jgi:MFS family permease